MGMKVRMKEDDEKIRHLSPIMEKCSGKSNIQKHKIDEIQKLKGKYWYRMLRFMSDETFAKETLHTHTLTETQNDIIWTRLSFSQNSFKQKRLFSCDIQFKGLSSFASLILLLLVSVYPPFSRYNGNSEAKRGVQ